MTRAGKRNLITDVDGVLVGQAEDQAVRTGVTVILTEKAFAAAVDVRGGAPGTVGTDALDPVNLVGAVDGVVLSGGSSYGLEAASAVMAWLGARGRGFRFAPEMPAAPIVPGAIIFDLANGGDKDWGEAPPYRALALQAARRAAAEFVLGNTGAGTGAMAGIYKGGTGSASAIGDSGATVGAFAIVNSVGSPLIPYTDVFWAFPFEQENEFGGRRPAADFPPVDAALPKDVKGAALAGANTTIAVVATDADLSGVELKRLAIMAADGFARALRPVHTPFDGDTVFAIATAKRTLAEPRAYRLMELGNAAADCLARAIARGVYEAATLGELKCYRDVFREKKEE
ncbi:MAG TPA: P1 family peptidase [Rhizomicrobium sp.]|jgi:L-aminopeptidase/D-esterase-like protein|nr:P1 family peptidase [Rhizomicrobium sp.]